jgi:hypothetical protein
VLLLSLLLAAAPRSSWSKEPLYDVYSRVQGSSPTVQDVIDLVSYYESPNPSDRESVLRFLDRTKPVPPALIPAFPYVSAVAAKALSDPEWKVSRAAREMQDSLKFWHSPPPARLVELGEKLRTVNGAVSDVGALAQFLGDSDPYVRMAALEAMDPLHFYGRKLELDSYGAVSQEAAAALKDPDPKVRRKAEALQASNDSEYHRYTDEERGRKFEEREMRKQTLRWGVIVFSVILGTILIGGFALGTALVAAGGSLGDLKALYQVRTFSYLSLMAISILPSGFILEEHLLELTLCAAAFLVGVFSRRYMKENIRMIGLGVFLTDIYWGCVAAASAYALFIFAFVELEKYVSAVVHHLLYVALASSVTAMLGAWLGEQGFQRKLEDAKPEDGGI